MQPNRNPIVHGASGVLGRAAAGVGMTKRTGGVLAPAPF